MAVTWVTANGSLARVWARSDIPGCCRARTEKRSDFPSQTRYSVQVDDTPLAPPAG